MAETHPGTDGLGWHDHPHEHDGERHIHDHRHRGRNGSHDHAHSEPLPRRPERLINLRGGDELRYVEIITRAGVVRVNANLVGTHDGRQHVVVEIEPSARGMARSGDGAHWDTEVREHAGRIDITLIREA